METERSKLTAMLEARCPRCREGYMFRHGPLDYAHFTQVYDDCTVCKLHFEPEPGFWQGAMYTGYGFSVAIFISCFVGVYVLGHNPDAWVYISVTVVATLLLAPLNFRYSRVMMLYLFGGVQYRGRVKNEK